LEAEAASGSSRGRLGKSDHSSYRLQLMTTIEEFFQADLTNPSQLRAIELAKNDYRFLSELVKIRKDLGLSQQDVADRLGISQPAVAAFERHDADPKMSTIRRYAHAVGILVGHVAEKDEGQLLEGEWTPMALYIKATVSDLSSKSFPAAANKKWDFSLAA
jgi:transcriptional regulator with XRE-family HTH domain